MSGSFVQELKRRNVFRAAVIYNSVRDTPDFQAMVDLMNADMTEQLAAIEALPYLGEYDFRENVEN